MKSIYIIVMLVIAASVLGCAGQEKAGTPGETSVKTPAATALPAETPSGTAVPSNGNAGNDVFGTENEIMQLESMFNETNMDISLSEI